MDILDLFEAVIADTVLSFWTYPAFKYETW